MFPKFFTMRSGYRYQMLLSLLLCFTATAKSQVYIHGGNITIHSDGIMAIKGNLETEASIAGNGKIILNGNTPQQLNMQGNALPLLEIDNLTQVNLESPALVNTGIQFNNGKVFLHDHDLTLGNTAGINGQSNQRFIVTNGNGYLKKLVFADLVNFEMPVGNGNNYRPVILTSAGSYTNASVAVKDYPVSHPQRNIRSTDYTNNYWSFRQSGISGTLLAAGTYNDISGTENFLQSFFYNGSSLAYNPGYVNTSSDLIGGTIVGNGDLYAMNVFGLVKSRVFLQGPYNTSTGFMDDRLRNKTGAYTAGNYPVDNLIPLTDPYRSASLQPAFVHVNNAALETITTAVLQDKADATNNIVDWVFLELRNAVNAGTILQTRSALLQRNGDIVDLDGTSPVYFKNIEPGLYTIAVRHRNHLGISTDPSAITPLVDVNATGPIVDFSDLPSTLIFGTDNAYASAGNTRMLWAGNANANGNVRYNGPSNDRDYLLSVLLGGNQGTILNDVYNNGDFNMNRVVRYNGPSNDRDFLLAAVLASVQGTIRTQELP